MDDTEIVLAGPHRTYKVCAGAAVAPTGEDGVLIFVKAPDQRSADSLNGLLFLGKEECQALSDMLAKRATEPRSFTMRENVDAA